jgi:hypothetical protein
MKGERGHGDPPTFPVDVRREEEVREEERVSMKR